MGLLDRIFGNKAPRRGSGAPDSEPPDDDDDEGSTTQVSPRNAPRREVVQVVLRDTMRRHGIPSDWIECRILSVQSTTRGEGMHVLLVVRQGDDRLATYVHAFQQSFMQELVRLEPRAGDWVFGLSWQFEGKGVKHDAMPDPASWNAKAAAARDSGGLALTGAAGSGTATQEAAAPGTADDDDKDLQADLQALFAIRDAALKPAGADVPDFEPTLPGFSDSDAPRRT